MTEQLTNTFDELLEEIQQKYDVFRGTWESGDKDVFAELVFCICTVQSKAQSGWKAVQALESADQFNHPNVERIEQILSDSGVRFKSRKAQFIINAIDRFWAPKEISITKFLGKIINKKGEFHTRDWLADNVKGIGMKEASHFMRNVGFGDDLAILDRHTLNSLVEFNVIKMPKSMNKKEYIRIEEEMNKFSRELNIPMFALDFVFWARKHKGEIFK